MCRLIIGSEEYGEAFDYIKNGMTHRLEMRHALHSRLSPNTNSFVYSEKEKTMIRDMMQEDKTIFMAMAKDFYSSKAVAHNIDVKIIETTFDTAINEPHRMRAYIIEDDDKPVGFALTSFYYATEIGGTVVLLEDLYLDETCRGKGFGSKFIEFMEKEYPAAKRFHLEVAKENIRAIDLYKRLGYEVLEYVQMVKNK